MARFARALAAVIMAWTASCGASHGAPPSHPDSPLDPRAEPAPLPAIGESFADQEIEMESEPAPADLHAGHGEPPEHGAEHGDAGVAPDGAVGDAGGGDHGAHHAH